MPFRRLLGSRRYHVPTPASPEGRRIVAESASLLDGTTGRLFVADPGSFTTRKTDEGRWSIGGGTGGHDPIQAGQWSLRWHGEQAVFPVADGNAPQMLITCQYK